MQIRGRQEERYGLCDKVNTNLWVPQTFVSISFSCLQMSKVRYFFLLAQYKQHRES
jgi:hypothetical protein